jgi:leucyl/phenylalanyl-tRNA--protein transferase
VPVYLLDKSPVFPDPNDASEEGLLAIGGDLSVDRLVEAYKHGIFPWYSDDDPVLWWSPDPRFVLFPEKFRMSKNLKNLIKSGKFKVSFNTDFPGTIHQCAVVNRKHEDGTWITRDMENAYTALHKAGFAHSVEVYLHGNLAGGLYGVSLGRAFFGESMFHLVNDASKVALYYLVEKSKENGILFIDCQLRTNHLAQIGAEEISRKQYLHFLNIALSDKTINYFKS